MAIVSVPYWFLVALTALLPLRWLGFFLHGRSKPRAGYCAACGYNLTGNTTGVCPECGSTVAGAQAQRQLRLRRMRLMPLAIVLLAPFAGRTLIDQVREHKQWNRLLERQSNYTEYAAPADRVVYCEDPVASRELLASDPHYHTIGNCACYVADLGERIPGIHLTRNGGPIVFLHGRKSSGGLVRLVVVSIMEDAEVLCIDEFVPISADQRDAYQTRQSDVVVRRWPRQRMTILAGQVDPRDSSHFTIGYRLDDQPGTLEGWLMDDGSVRMQVRDGPAEVLQASPKPLTNFGKQGRRSLVN